MDGGAWLATVHGVAKSQTRLSNFTFTFVHECVCAKLLQLCLILCEPVDQLARLCWPTKFLCPWGFSRQVYLPWPPPGDLPNPEIKPRSPALQADSLPSQPPVKPRNTGALQPHGPQPARLLCPWNFFMQEHQHRLPFLSPGDLPDAGIKPVSLSSPVLASGFFTAAPPWKPILYIVMYVCQSQSPNSPHHHPSPTRCPCVCSLCLCPCFFLQSSSYPIPSFFTQGNSPTSHFLKL